MKIWQTNVVALCDSGSDISIIDGRLLDSFSQKPTLIPSDFPNIIAANNSRTDILGAAILPLNIGGNVMEVKFHVIQSANFDMILRKDLIGEFVETIHVQSKTVVLKDKEGVEEKQVKMNNVQAETSDKFVQVSAKTVTKIDLEPGKR